MIGSSAQTDLVSASLVAAYAASPAVKSSGRNEHDRYEYPTIHDFATCPRVKLLAAEGSAIIFTPETVEHSERKAVNGSTMSVARVTGTARLIHRSGQYIDFVATGEGHDRADKAVYKAITGARKYAIASILCLAWGDDAEAETPAIDREPETIGQADAEALAEKLESLGLSIDALRSAMRKGGVTIDDDPARWPITLRPRIKAWMQAKSAAIKNTGTNVGNVDVSA